MTEIKPLNEVSTETWTRLASDLNLAQLDNLERDGVNIQCLNSSDFVIGRQTNFNGPVTIISCAEVLKQKHQEKKCEEENKEDVVVTDKVLSRSAMMKVQKLATDETRKGKMPKTFSKSGKIKKPTWIFGVICIGLLVAASAALAVFPITSTDDSLPKCTSLSNNFCIFSEFHWGGRPSSRSLTPLQMPVSHVIISQTHENHCYEVPVCLKFVKLLQLNTSDETACNFFVGGDGNAYEDRGWGWNSLKGPAAGKGIQICLMGNYSDEEYPTYPQIATIKLLVWVGVENDYISKNYVLAASNATLPQKYLGSIYNIINKWPNFCENPFPQQNYSNT